MIEKSFRNTDISKLRAILLLEADFNTIGKIIFNSRLMLSLEKSKDILIEIIGRRRRQLL